tara:strand:+ start:725 stop:1714 length:990 start_codon:yes stop_codon:yes gene_type:complete
MKPLMKPILIMLLFLSFAAVPFACSSSDNSVDLAPIPEPEPEVVVDPTNSNTTIEATEPMEADATLTSTVTVQLANNDGTLLTTGGAAVVLTTTGAAVILAVTDNGDGTYTASISSSVNETVLVTGTLEGVAISDTAVIDFKSNDPNPTQEIVQSTEPVGPSLIRINSGGPEVTYGDVTFLADQYFVGFTMAFTNPYVTEITKTNMDELYLTERVADSLIALKGPFSYAIPVTNGSYTIKLHFAEIFWGVENPNRFEGGIGSRVFNISIESTEIFTGYDIYKEVGAASAVTRMYDIEVTDGELNIIFESTVNRPKVSAIEVFGSGTIGS